MSRFISFAIHVTNEDEAKDFIKKIQNKYHDARHVCWAYMIGPEHLRWQLNDNGEPSGTAGKPILGQINSFNLTDICIVVVRYFGGIKLGTSGLIVAYREAAKLAIENAEISEMYKTKSISVNFPYQSINDVMKIAKRDEVTILSQSFDNTCSISISVREKLFDEINGKLLSLDGVTPNDN
ncbi:MAG: YigZ family protein [Bacteroides sp.]|nr:YigZ family protein [Bacteroides sp.]